MGCAEWMKGERRRVGLRSRPGPHKNKAAYGGKGGGRRGAACVAGGKKRGVVQAGNAREKAGMGKCDILVDKAGWRRKGGREGGRRGKREREREGGRSANSETL